MLSIPERDCLLTIAIWVDTGIERSTDLCPSLGAKRVIQPPDQARMGPSGTRPHRNHPSDFELWSVPPCDFGQN
jgi:hypothetical protein